MGNICHGHSCVDEFIEKIMIYHNTSRIKGNITEIVATKQIIVGKMYLYRRIRTKNKYLKLTKSLFKRTRIELS